MVFAEPSLCRLNLEDYSRCQTIHDYSGDDVSSENSHIGFALAFGPKTHHASLKGKM